MPTYSNYRAVSNTRISARLRQVLILALTIVAGILISVTVNS